MTPLGLSGGSQDRLSVSAVDLIRWTVGTAEGAGGQKNEDKDFQLLDLRDGSERSVRQRPGLRPFCLLLSRGGGGGGGRLLLRLHKVQEGGLSAG